MINMKESLHIIYLFIDGIGFAPYDTETNPFSRYAKSYLAPLGGKEPAKSLPADFFMKKIDPHQGVAGLPQSASGQCSLWTGVNGSLVTGYHKSGFPGYTLKKIIKKHSIIKKLNEANYKATLLNAYSPRYIEHLKKKPRLWSASSCVQHASGQDFHTHEDIPSGQAIYMDYTHEIMHRLFEHLREEFPVISPAQVAQNIITRARNYDLVLHEFFLTDKAGHSANWELAAWCVKTIEAVLTQLIDKINPQKELLLVTSDHGNFECMDIKTHSHNAVPLFAYGAYAEEAIDEINELTDIPRFIYKKKNLFDYVKELDEVNTSFRVKAQAVAMPAGG